LRHADQRLQDLGIQLPELATSFGTYAAAMRTGNSDSFRDIFGIEKTSVRAVIGIVMKSALQTFATLAFVFVTVLTLNAQNKEQPMKQQIFYRPEERPGHPVAARAAFVIANVSTAADAARG
jgi:hypothetical protein